MIAADGDGRAQIVDVIAEILLDDLDREESEDTEQRKERRPG